MAKKRINIQDLVIPHKRNGYKPGLLSVSAVLVTLMVLVGMQAAYFFDTKFAFSKIDFLASVLPSVLIGFTNDDRTAQGLDALTPDDVLAKAAQLKAEDMAAKGYFAHVSPEGKTPWYWLDQVGYPYSYAGENLAIDFKDSKEVEDAWMASPAHHANIVKPQYTRIGIGTAEGMYEGQKTTFVVQYFASVRKGASTPSLSGVGSTNNPRVLGAEVEPLTLDAFTLFFARVAASPLHTITYVLSGIAGLFLFLLFIAIVVHARIQFIEVLGGGLLVVLASLGLMAYNAMDAGARVPDAPNPVASTNSL